MLLCLCTQFSVLTYLTLQWTTVVGCYYSPFASFGAFGDSQNLTIITYASSKEMEQDSAFQVSHDLLAVTILFLLISGRHRQSKTMVVQEFQLQPDHHDPSNWTSFGSPWGLYAPHNGELCGKWV